MYSKIDAKKEKEALDHLEGAALRKKLRALNDDKFFRAMLMYFPEDPTPVRMKEAIAVMEKRFRNLSKPVQLTGALARAAQKSNIPMIDYLLGEGALIDGTKEGYIPGLLGPAKWSPLGSAISRGSEETVAHLLRMGADPNPPDNQFIYDAAYLQCSHEKTRILLDAGARGGAKEALEGSITTYPNDLALATLILDKTDLTVNTGDGFIVRFTLIAANDGQEGALETLQFIADRGADFKKAADLFCNNQELAALARLWHGRTQSGQPDAAPHPKGNLGCKHTPKGP